MKKFFYGILVLLFGVVLVGCKPKTPKVEVSTETLKQALVKFGENNYEMEVEVLKYDDSQSKIMVEIDGTKSHVKQGEFFEVYYERDGRNVTSYTKEGDKFVKSEERSPVDSKYQSLKNIDANWFDLVDGKFHVKEDKRADFVTIFNLDSDHQLEAAVIELNEDYLISSMFVTLKELSLRDTYYLSITFSGYGNVSINLPEVK